MKRAGVFLMLGLMVVFLLAGCGGGSSSMDQYEKLVDETIAVMKKAKAGDLSVMADAAKLQGQLEKLQKELEDKEDDLSEKDKERLEKAYEKLVKSLL
jgi:hypothetical protein